MIRLLFHSAAAALYCGTIWYDFHHIDLGPAIGWDAEQNLPEKNKKTGKVLVTKNSSLVKKSRYGGKLRFLTFINLCLHAIFFLLCVVHDVARLARLSPKRVNCLRDAKDHMFTVLVFPLGTFVCLMFWSIYIFDRELIFPQFLDNLFPAWANHVMHTAILPIALVEMWLDYHAHPKSRWSGLKNLVIFSLAYQAWTLWVYYHTSQWIYPIFNHLNGWQKVVFMSIGTVCILVLYFVGEMLQPRLCSKGHRVTESTKQSPSRKKVVKVPVNKKKV